MSDQTEATQKETRDHTTVWSNKTGMFELKCVLLCILLVFDYYHQAFVNYILNMDLVTFQNIFALLCILFWLLMKS